MENLKTCPYCGQEIKTAALKCRHCGKWLNESSQPEQPQSAPQSINAVADKLKQNDYFSFTSGGLITLKEALVEPFVMTCKNIGWLLLTVLLYAVTSWIPYINIGTTIAMMNLPSALARGQKFSPLYLFEAKYRKYMGEYLTMFGNYILVALASIPFMGIPFLITIYGWSFAPLLLIDKEVNTSEAFTLSTKMTYGYKLKMWLSAFIIEFALIVAVLITMFTGFIPVLLVLFFMMLSPAMTAVFYKHLVIERDKYRNR